MRVQIIIGDKENQGLVQAYSQTKNPSLKDLIFSANIGLARKQAHSYSLKTNADYDDLLQEASMGLNNAIERFNTDFNVSFSSFAIPYINGKILQFLRDKNNLIRISQSVQNLYIKYKRKVIEFTQQNGRHPTSKEICQILNCSDSQYTEIVLVNSPQFVKSLDCLSVEKKEWVSTINESISEESIVITSEDIARIKKGVSRREIWKEIASRDKSKAMAE